MTSREPDTHAPKKQKKDRQLQAYLYILPALLIIVGVIYLGIAYNGAVSMVSWNGLDDNAEFVWFDNYVRVFTDPTFAITLRNIAIFSAITIIIQMVIGLTMAVILSTNIFFRNVYKVVMFLPVVIAPAAYSVAFRTMMRPDGQINEALRALGLDFLTQDWIVNPDIALFSIAAVSMWAWTGFSFILYQAAISQIDMDVIEAAQIDGAGPWRILRSVIVPQVSGTHATLILIGVIGGLKTFEIVYLMTGGGPGRSTEFLTTYIYAQAINYFDAGYAAALSIVLLLISVALTVVQMRVNKIGRS